MFHLFVEVLQELGPRFGTQPLVSLPRIREAVKTGPCATDLSHWFSKLVSGEAVEGPGGYFERLLCSQELRFSPWVGGGAGNNGDRVGSRLPINHGVLVGGELKKLVTALK